MGNGPCCIPGTTHPGRLTCTVRSFRSSFPAKITRSWSAGTPCRLATTSLSWKMLVSESTSTGKPWLELNLTNTKHRQRDTSITPSPYWPVKCLWKCLPLACPSVNGIYFLSFITGNFIHRAVARKKKKHFPKMLPVHTPVSDLQTKTALCL